tara:strand:- start:345 stop:1289 length:945 start_codon:yes stop_codon:yes gene_type:complete
MNYKVMKRPMFRLGGSARPGYSTGTSLKEIEKLIGERAAEREKFMNFQRSTLPFQVLAGQPGLQTIRKPTDVLSLLSDIGQDPNLFNALIKGRSLDLKMKDKELDDKIKLATMKSKAAGSSTRLKSEAAIRRIETKIVDLENKKGLLEGQTGPEAQKELDKINNDLRIEKQALKAFVNENLRIRAVDALSKNLYQGQQLSEEDIQRQIDLYKGADGGRVGYQEGTPEPMMQETVDVQETMQPEAPKENAMSVKQMYDLMRQRIPAANVSDKDLYKIASSEQIMADFASLETMSDVTQFNEQYDTNIVLDLPIVG